MLAILSPILVAVCSGLAFLAYKHPKGFSKIADALTIALSIAVGLYLSWYLGFQSGFYSADKLESYEDGAPISFGYTIIIAFSAYVYLAILQLLPQILSEDEKPVKDEEDTETKDA